MSPQSAWLYQWHVQHCSRRKHLQHSSAYSIPPALYPNCEHNPRQFSAVLLYVKKICQGNVLTCSPFTTTLSLLCISTNSSSRRWNQISTHVLQPIYVQLCIPPV